MILVESPELEVSKAWLCSTCGLCKELCPKEVTPLEVMLSARGVLLRSGSAPEDRIVSLRNIAETGFAYRASEKAERKRTSLGLPDLKLDDRQIEEVRSLIRNLLEGKGG